MHFYIQGKYVEETEAKISVLDLGLIRGYAVFDYLRTYGGQPFHLQDHIDRLRYSAQQVGMDLSHSFEELEEIVLELLKRGSYPESSIKILLTGGVSSDQMLPDNRSELIVFAYPHKPYPAALFTGGIKTTTTQLKRSFPQCKTLHYLPAIVSLQKGKEKGATEVLYLNENEEILEATSSNFFACKDGVLLTPPDDEILVGITREVIIKICERKGIPVMKRSLRYEEISSFDEAFVTASNKEVMPVVQINDSVIGSGTVGPMTLHIQRLFGSYIENKEWASLSIPRYTHDKAKRACLVSS